MDEHNMQQSRYDVRPLHINSCKLPFNMMGDPEAEHAACLIVRLCSSGDLWRSFTKEELTELHNGSYKKKKQISFGSLCPEADEYNPLNLVVKSRNTVESEDKNGNLIIITPAYFCITTAFVDMYSAFAPFKKAA